jgi:carboxyl-terminal processing protease
MNRERSAWLLSLLLLAVAAFRSPTAAQRDSDYRFVRTLVDINRQVAANYVDPVDQNTLEKGAIDGMLNQLDPFTIYVPPARREEFDRMLEGTFKGVGVQLNQLPSGVWEVLTPIDGSPAFRAGVLAGDAIVKVNGESIDNLRLEDVIKKIAGEPGTSVTLTVRHLTGETVDLTMKREDIAVPTVKGYRRNPNNGWDYYVAANPKIAYLRITQFTPTTFDNVKTALTELLNDGMKGLILDLRWNPGGQLDQAVQVVDLFLDKGTIVVTKGRNRPEVVNTAVETGTLPWFPLIVLVNEGSASAAEIVAGSLMDNKRAAVVGQRTYGKGSVQELIPLDGNSGELKLTVAYYYLPSGRLVHRKKNATDWGVEPQVIVPMDEETQRKVVEERYRQEIFRRPTTGPSTQSTTAATQPLDLQLQRAVDTMILMTTLQAAPRPVAETPPATRPAQ